MEETKPTIEELEAENKLLRDELEWWKSRYSDSYNKLAAYIRSDPTYFDGLPYSPAQGCGRMSFTTEDEEEVKTLPFGKTMGDKS